MSMGRVSKLTHPPSLVLPNAARRESKWGETRFFLCKNLQRWDQLKLPACYI